MSFILNNKIDIEDGPRKLAFGAVKTASSFTQFLDTRQNDNGEDRWELVTQNGGSGTWREVKADYLLSVTSDQGSRAVRRTFEDFIYQPGSSSRVDISGSLGPKQAGIQKRIGLYDDFNGLFFQQDGDEFAVIIRSTLSSGNTTETKIKQSDFNIDKLDGTGPSKVDINTEFVHVFHIDFSWHGTGRVRWGLVTGEDILYFHFSDFFNSSSDIYMGKANLPLTYEIENVIGTTSGSEMRQLSSSYKVDGGFAPLGFSRNVFTDQSQMIVIPDDGEWYSTVSIRVKSNCPRCSVSIISQGIVNTSNSQYQSAIIKNPNGLNNATWSDNTEATEVSIDKIQITPGTVVIGDAGARRSSASLQTDLVRDKINSITVGSFGTQQIFTLAVRSVAGTNPEISGAFNFVEFR